MLASYMASCDACISRRAPKIESFFESRWVAKTAGFCTSPSGIEKRLAIFLTILTFIAFLRIPRHCPCAGEG